MEQIISIVTTRSVSCYIWSDNFLIYLIIQILKYFKTCYEPF